MHLDSEEEDEWLQELLTCHRLGSSAPTTIGMGSGSSAPSTIAWRAGSSASTIALGAGSSAPTSALGAGSSAPTVNFGAGASALDLSDASSSAPRASAKRAFVSRAKSLGTLPNVDIPKRLDVVMWDVQWWAQHPEMWQDPCKRGMMLLAAWLEAMGPAIFKCGIAADPVDRYFNATHGYVLEDRLHFMQVFWQGPADQCRQVEIDFIAMTKGVEGCCNEKDGGDGVRADRNHECFVYLVLASAGDGVSLKKSRRLLQQGSGQACST